jgi:hypothetical protein
LTALSKYQNKNSPAKIPSSSPSFKSRNIAALQYPNSSSSSALELAFASIKDQQPKTILDRQKIGIALAPYEE